MKKKILSLLLLLFLMLNYAVSSPLITVKFKNSVVREGEIISYDTKGIKFKTKQGVVIFFPWYSIDDESVKMIRQFLAISEDEVITSINNRILKYESGVIITTNEGDLIKGKLLKEFDSKEASLIKTEGKLIRILKKDIKFVKDKLLPLNDIYNKSEIYDFITSNVSFTRDINHYDIARKCELYGLKDKAQFHYFMYEIMRRGQIPDETVFTKIAATMLSTTDEAYKNFLYLVGMDLINENFASAISRIEQIKKEDRKFSKNFGIEVIYRDLKARTDRTIKEKVVYYWELNIEGIAMELSEDSAKSYGKIFQYVTEKMSDEIALRIARKLGMTKEDVLTEWMGRNLPMRSMSYGNSSWILNSSNIDDPELWWVQASQADKVQFIKALYAEFCMHKIIVTQKNCPSCGGYGRIEEPHNIYSLIVCSKCKGLGKIRVVVFK